MQQNDPESQKNLMLAIGLSVAILLLWQVFYGMPKMKEEQERNRRQAELHIGRFAERLVAVPADADDIDGTQVFQDLGHDAVSG